MDQQVTIRYFTVESVGAHGIAFEAALQAAMDLGEIPHERERDVTNGVTVRLEALERRQGLYIGEVVRVQRENIPPEAQDHALIPLTIGGLGHSVAFAYDPQSTVLAIQFDTRGVSVSRFMSYLAAVSPGARYHYEAVVNEDAWDRYNRGEPRSLTVAIANPQNLPNVEGEVSSVIQSSKRLAEIAHAPVITISVSMGHIRRRNLLRGFVDNVIRTFTEGDAADADVQKLRVKSKQPDLPSDEIDFINDLSRDQETLELPSNDHAVNIERRLAFVLRSFRPRLAGLREMYGQG